MKNTQIDRYQTCIIHGEVEVVPSTNGTEYTELCPVCEVEKSMSAEDALKAYDDAHDDAHNGETT